MYVYTVYIYTVVSRLCPVMLLIIIIICLNPVMVYDVSSYSLSQSVKCLGMSI
jgi:hypothetical protein